MPVQYLGQVGPQKSNSQDNVSSALNQKYLSEQLNSLRLQKQMEKARFYQEHKANSIKLDSMRIALEEQATRAAAAKSAAGAQHEVNKQRREYLKKNPNYVRGQMELEGQLGQEKIDTENERQAAEQARASAAAAAEALARSRDERERQAAKNMLRAQRREVILDITTQWLHMPEEGRKTLLAAIDSLASADGDREADPVAKVIQGILTDPSLKDIKTVLGTEEQTKLVELEQARAELKKFKGDAYIARKKAIDEEYKKIVGSAIIKAATSEELAVLVEEGFISLEGEPQRVSGRDSSSSTNIFLGPMDEKAKDKVARAALTNVFKKLKNLGVMGGDFSSAVDMIKAGRFNSKEFKSVYSRLDKAQRDHLDLLINTYKGGEEESE